VLQRICLLLTQSGHHWPFQFSYLSRYDPQKWGRV
jgi:hypothetical protein